MQTKALINALRQMVWKDLTCSFRNRSQLIGALILNLLAILSLIAHYQYSQNTNHAISELQESVDRQWDEQPARHPHRVVHFGHFVFRPISPLSFFDRGIDSFVGHSVFLEAHQQNSINFSNATASSNMLQFGELTLATLLQYFLPLIIIVLLFGQFIPERDGSLLRIHLISGIPIWCFAISKFLATVIIVILALSPTVVLTALMYLKQMELQLLPRVFVIGLLYLCYICTWVGFSVILFLRHRNHRKALSVLVTLWIFSCFIMPRLLPALAERLYPTPNIAEFNLKLYKDVAESINAHKPSDPKFMARKKEVLEEHGVKKVSELPFNFKGYAYKISEESTTKIYNKHYNGIYEIYYKQNHFIEAFSFLSPLIATRVLSQSITGTDTRYAHAFQRQAENHRYELIQKVNDLHIHKIDYKNDKKQHIDQDEWNKFSDFEYQQPSLLWGLKYRVLSISAVFTLLSAVFLGLTLIRVKV